MVGASRRLARRKLGDGRPGGASLPTKRFCSREQNVPVIFRRKFLANGDSNIATSPLSSTNTVSFRAKSMDLSILHHALSSSDPSTSLRVTTARVRRRSPDRAVCLTTGLPIPITDLRSRRVRGQETFAQRRRNNFSPATPIRIPTAYAAKSGQLNTEPIVSAPSRVARTASIHGA